MRTKHIIELDSEKLLKLKKLALKNGLKTNAQSCADLAIDVAIDCANYLDKDSFLNITGKNNDNL